MSLHDFEILTLAEFGKAYEYWQNVQQRNERAPWEVMRMQVALTLQPFVKKDIDPKKIFPLPWDRNKPRELTAAERKAQNERVKRYLTTGHWD